MISDYLGERPTISVQKCTLRRVDPDAGHGWHQDGAFMGDVRALNVWLSLSRCGDEAPGMDVVPRRLDHLVPTGTEGALFEWSVSPQVAEEAAGETGVLRPIFEPGDVLLFDDLFLHSTAAEPSMKKSRMGDRELVLRGLRLARGVRAPRCVTSRRGTSPVLLRPHPEDRRRLALRADAVVLRPGGRLSRRLGRRPDHGRAAAHIPHLLLERWKARRDEIRVVTGHFPLCVTELLDADFATFTVLRDPVERTLSYLRHHRDTTPPTASSRWRRSTRTRRASGLSSRTTW